MKLNACLLYTMLLIFAAPNAFSANLERTYYSPDLCKSTDKNKIKSSVYSSLANLNAERSALEAFAKELADEKNIMADVLEKRLQIADRLGRYLENLLKSSEPDALLYARQGASELDQMLVYFKEAKEYVEFLKTVPIKRVINVKDFGAKGDGVSDDAQAFVKAMEEAKKTSGRVKVFVPAGTYLFGNYRAERTFSADTDSWREWRPDYEGKGDIPFIPQIEDKNNITVEGEKGSVLLSSDPRRGFLFFSRCSYLTFRNLTFDYRQLPFTQGDVVNVDEKNFIVRLKIDKGFPAPDLDYFLTAPTFYGIAFNQSGENIRQASFQRITAVRDAGDGIYELKFMKAPRKLSKPGCKLAILARRSRSGLLRSRFGSHIYVDGITVNASPGHVLGGFYLSDYVVVNCRVMPPIGSSRLIGPNSDPCMIGNTAIGPYFRNNIFTNSGDDAANEYIGGQQVKSIAKDGRSMVVKWGGYSAGNAISLLSPSDGVIKGEAKVNSVTEVIHGLLRLELDSTVPCDVPTLDSLNQKVFLSKKEKDNFHKKKALKLKHIPCIVLNRSHTGSGTVFINNTFRNCYRGILVKVSNALLEGNTIEGMDRSAVAIMIYAHYWRESNAAHNVVMRNNIFRKNGSVNSYYQIHGSKVAPGLTPMRDILVQNNTFEETPVSFDNCRDITMSGNTFDAKSPLQFGVARKAIIEGNTFSLPEKEAVVVGGEAEDVVKGANRFPEDK